MGSLLLQRWYRVAIRVVADRNVRVSQALLDDLGVRVGLEQDRGVEVAEIVETDMGHTALGY